MTDDTEQCAPHKTQSRRSAQQSTASKTCREKRGAELNKQTLQGRERGSFSAGPEGGGLLAGYWAATLITSLILDPSESAPLR